MRLDEMAGRMAHAAELLRQVMGSEEMNSRFAEIATKDDGELGAVEFDTLNHAVPLPAEDRQFYSSSCSRTDRCPRLHKSQIRKPRRDSAADALAGFLQNFRHRPYISGPTIGFEPSPAALGEPRGQSLIPP